MFFQVNGENISAVFSHTNSLAEEQWQSFRLGIQVNASTTIESFVVEFGTHIYPQFELYC